MSENAWLTIVIGSAAVVAVVAVGFVLRTIRATGATELGATQPASTRVEPLMGHRRRARLRWRTHPRLRRVRSVEDNLLRACDRIDAIDPYVVQRRIGSALAEVGLISSPSVFDDPPLPARTRSSSEAPHRGHRWEDEA